jgi:hypothetical protein
MRATAYAFEPRAADDQDGGLFETLVSLRGFWGSVRHGGIIHSQKRSRCPSNAPCVPFKLILACSHRPLISPRSSVGNPTQCSVSADSPFLAKSDRPARSAGRFWPACDCAGATKDPGVGGRGRSRLAADCGFPEARIQFRVRQLWQPTEGPLRPAAPLLAPPHMHQRIDFAISQFRRLITCTSGFA